MSTAPDDLPPATGTPASAQSPGSTSGDDYDHEYDSMDDDRCSWCGGDGEQDPDDPLFEGRGPIACKACGGTGLASKQTIW